MPHRRDLSVVCRHEGIKNLWLVGCIEKGTSATAREFHPRLWWIYVQFHTAFVRFEAINEWHIQFDVVEKIGIDFEVDPPDEFATMPIGSLFLPTVPKDSYKVIRFDALIDEESDPGTGKIKTGGFVFEGGETVFFDPSNT